MIFADYCGKHCARYYGWLRASKEYKEQFPSKALKYFTLCAKEAIDIFMLEKEGVLSRDENGNLPNVIICESKREDAIEIFDVVKPPMKGAIIVGKLEELIMHEDDDEIKQLLKEGESAKPSKEQRAKLYIHEKAYQLKSQFPFEIINFDAYGNFLNPNNPGNKLLYLSFKKIFELQKPTKSFLLFVTTPITHIHINFQTSFRKNFESNVSTHTKIKEALLSSIGKIDYKDIDYNKKIALNFAKSIVMPAARKEGWESEHKGIYIYENRDSRKMLNSVVQFSRRNITLSESVYIEDVVRVIEKMPEYYSYKDALNNAVVKGHLKEVQKYREKIQDEFRNKPREEP